jgi:hypothetical protein
MKMCSKLLTRRSAVICAVIVLDQNLALVECCLDVRCYCS